MIKYSIPSKIKKYPYAAWVGGDGWSGHRTVAAAWRSARKTARAPEYQGYPPAIMVLDCRTGQAVQE